MYDKEATKHIILETLYTSYSDMMNRYIQSLRKCVKRGDYEAVGGWLDTMSYANKEFVAMEKFINEK